MVVAPEGWLRRRRFAPGGGCTPWWSRRRAQRDARGLREENEEPGDDEDAACEWEPLTEMDGASTKLPWANGRASHTGWQRGSIPTTGLDAPAGSAPCGDVLRGSSIQSDYAFPAGNGDGSPTGRRRLQRRSGYTPGDAARDRQPFDGVESLTPDAGAGVGGPGRLHCGDTGCRRTEATTPFVPL